MIVITFGDSDDSDGAIMDEDVGENEETILTSGQVRSILESLLLIVDLPVAEKDLAQAIGVEFSYIHEVMVNWQYELETNRSGMQLRFLEGGWRLYTNPDYSFYVERFLRKGSRAKLSRAALETLAIVAYRQPVSRQDVASIRGVNVDSIMRTLQARGLISLVEKDDAGGGVHRYCTTQEFLERLGLTDISQLPPIVGFLPERNSLEEFTHILSE